MLVLEPTDAGHDACLYFTPRAPRDSEEFYADARFGEMWVGRRPSLDELSALCGISCADIDELADHLRKNAEGTAIRVIPGVLDAEHRRVDRRDPRGAGRGWRRGIRSPRPTPSSWSH